MKCPNCNAISKEQGSEYCYVCGTKLVEDEHEQDFVKESPKYPIDETHESIETPKNVPASKREFTINGISFNMIYVEGGTFWMGAQKNDENTRNFDSDAITIEYDFYKYPLAHDSREDPVHKVTLSSFYISETLVTQGLWETVMGYARGTHWRDGRGMDYPLYDVGDKDSVDYFLKRLNNLTNEVFRLPTEAEWEFAARGGCYSIGYKFSGSNNIDEVAWWEGNSKGHPHPVARKKPNELGLYDMSGNLDELCSDSAREYLSCPQTNPHNSERAYEIIRGGNFKFGHQSSCRVTARNNCRLYPNKQLPKDVGLRLVLSQNIDYNLHLL